MAGQNATIASSVSSKIYKATTKAKVIIRENKKTDYFSNYLSERDLEIKDLKLTSEQRDQLKKLI